MTDTPSPRKRIVIIGSGIAGLTAAHELSRFGKYDIQILEQNPIPGGKARSLRRDDGNVGEHSMRIYPAAYSNLFRVMKEIPFKDKTVYDNLHYGPFRFQYRGLSVTLDSGYSGFLSHIWKAIRIYYFFWRCGVTLFELAIFTHRISSLLWMTPEHVRTYLEEISFETYFGGTDRSKAFQDVVLRFPEMLVAAKPYASAAVVTRMLLEFFIGPFLISEHKRLGFAQLNGPTSERFINPWVTHLEGSGVRFRYGIRVTRLSEEGRKVVAVSTACGQRIEADIFICAVQHNILRVLLGNSNLSSYAGIEQLAPLAEEWANGMQYFLSYIPEKWKAFIGCHTVCADSPWSLCIIIYTRDTWPGIALPESTAGILSVSVSDSSTLGIRFRKYFNRCTRDELLEEALIQAGLIEDKAAVIEGYVGPDLHYIPRTEFIARQQEFDGYGARAVDGGEFVVVSDSMLYIRSPGNAAIEPENRSDLVNLYIAGEFTRTLAAMPSMEKSCESGTRCADAVDVDNLTALEPSRVGAAQFPFAFLRTTRIRWMRRITITVTLILTVIYVAIQVSK